MIPVEALKLALSQEIRSMELYQDLCEKNPQLKEIFLFLINEEQKHRQLIEKKISDLTRD